MCVCVCVKEQVSYESEIQTSRHMPVTKLCPLPRYIAISKKSIFERYMKNRDDETKYDYLLTSTTGEAKTYVINKATYAEAITRLDDFF